MKKLSSLLLMGFLFPLLIRAQVPMSFNPEIQEITSMQYFCPVEDNYFAGDPIPFYHEGKFHAFWLLDSANNHLPYGKHQWAHSSSTDLIHWEHHSLALPLDWENSIGTGSVFFHKNVFYIFYLCRMFEENGDEIQVIGRATSKDGIHFKKDKKAFLKAPEGYDKNNFRDPHVFFDDKSGIYYMVITTNKTGQKFKHQTGSLVYYTSKDFKDWEFKGDFYIPGSADGFSIPECPTLFKWNDWYYLTYKVTGGTYYRMAHYLPGPWIAPVEDNIGNDYALVHKIAGFRDNRMIAVGMAPSRTNEKDDGGWEWGGKMVFRELFQNHDGTLYSGQVKEMQSPVKNLVKKDMISIDAENGFDTSFFSDIPEDAHIRFDFVPGNNYEQAGLLLRFSESGYYELRFSHHFRKVSLGSQAIEGVFGLDKAFTVDIVMDGDIIDVCIEGKRCILNRCYEQKGNELVFFMRNGKGEFRNISIDSILE